MIRKQLGDSPIVYYTSETGQGSWILFLHAAFVNHEMFHSQFMDLQDDYRLLAVDLIGHGQSVNTKKGDSMCDMSKWICAILDQEHIASIHIVGVSLGAVIAQDFANHYPHRVHSLACFGGYDINHFDVHMQKANSHAQMLMMAKAIISIKWFAQANKQISAYTPQAQTAFYEMNTQFSRKSFRYFTSLQKMINVFTEKKHHYPLLMGCGDHDVEMALQSVKSWKQQEEQSYAIVFRHAGHCVNMDVPKTFYLVMRAFWESDNVIASLANMEDIEILSSL